MKRKIKVNESQIYKQIANYDKRAQAFMSILHKLPSKRMQQPTRDGKSA
jgi:hypothetical protein